MSTINIERVLNMYNYFDSAVITDHRGVILYYFNMRTDLYDLRLKEIVGKTVLDIHPDLTEETSTIMQVLKSGKPIYDRVQKLTTPHGQFITNMYSTLPLIQGGKIVGVIDLARCIDEGFERENIVIPKLEVDGPDQLYHVSDIITASAKMKEIKLMIPKVANTDSSVLIYGETGTGKELIAQSIHTSSGRAGKNFVSQNCAAIPSTLLESILFGTVKGSYTGAEDRPGLFEVADGGTLFLDEINSMELPMQAKILKAIEEKRATRVGAAKAYHFDVKVISATNEDPYECVRRKALREDLLYRLNTVQIDIPPLRERIADIERLTEYFIATFNSRMNRNVLGATEAVKNIFEGYDWPGNVRELRNVIEGAFNIIGSRIIQVENLPPYLTRHYEAEQEKITVQNENMSLAQKVEAYERRLIVHALDSTHSISEAAGRLKMSKQALNYKLNKYGLRGES